jgi:hypothetical protein
MLDPTIIVGVFSFLIGFLFNSSISRIRCTYAYYSRTPSRRIQAPFRVEEASEGSLHGWPYREGESLTPYAEKL